jgi:hypothetical protein
MSRPRVRPVIAGTAALALVAFGVFACSDSSGSSNSPTCLGTLSGRTYAQDSISFFPGDTIAASGTLGLIDDTLYVLNLTSPSAVQDSGHYCVAANGSWTQNSYLGAPQSTGTYTAAGDQLFVDATSSGVRVLNWFTQQP